MNIREAGERNKREGRQKEMAEDKVYGIIPGGQSQARLDNGGASPDGREKRRDSSLELFRIISMLVIISHHYVVNSGLIECVKGSSVLDLGIFLFGWGGKIGINCFMMITGYFMCTAHFDDKLSGKKFLLKFVRLVGEIEFYKVIFFLVFTLTGYQGFSFKKMMQAIFPIWEIDKNFTGCFLLFYLLIPFLCRLVQNMSEREHIVLICILLFTYTVLGTLKLTVSFNYVTWFCVLFIISSYIRLYPRPFFSDKRIWGGLSVVMLFLSWASVIIVAMIGSRFGISGGKYFFVMDSHKALAVATAVCAFMFFKNLRMPYNKTINTIAASCFGVLCIHANSDAMRSFLWGDVFQNVGNYANTFPRAFGVVILVYVVCTGIDMVRIKWIERPVFKKLEEKYISPGR